MATPEEPHEHLCTFGLHKYLCTDPDDADLEIGVCPEHEGDDEAEDKKTGKKKKGRES